MRSRCSDRSLIMTCILSVNELYHTPQHCIGLDWIGSTYLSVCVQLLSTHHFTFRITMLSLRSSALRRSFVRFQSSTPSSGAAATKSHGLGAANVPNPSTPIPHLTPDASTPKVFQQSPNYPTTWSTGQNPKLNAMKGPRFEQTDIRFQANPFAGIQAVSEDPIRLVDGRKATCDGGQSWTRAQQTEQVLVTYPC